ncbi:LOW QUALITY PROTEIN: L-asparaginase-like [Centruroides sculpturatus]|uniref:LOW QUALITY PROTEIN: L-asparaginase-like n=1 Tax=Centruroides sculpturatus TaxID=218467 RepID=UPI000C6EFFE9|nr:LOW QUALITY PROTEIN: L-asparaginase-like [Centruroides sculpturatus]
MDSLDKDSSSCYATVNGINDDEFSSDAKVKKDIKDDKNSQRFKIDPYYAPKILRKNLNMLVRAPSSDSSTDQALVLVLYTGGTIGMMKTDKGVYAPQAGKLENGIRNFPNLHDEKYVAENFLKMNDKLPLALPKMDYSHKRLVYVIYEYEPLLDSSNMTMDDWIRIALDIKEFYELFDGFVILHGTDTMAYTASALSFMFEQLGKSVVITGSQIPLFETRSDGRENFLCSLIIAGIYNIYTGGTIGMMKTDKGVYAPQAGKLENGIRNFPNLHDEKYVAENFLKMNDKLPLALPKMDYSHKRLVYVIYEYEPLLDSSNMTMDDWIRIALDIKEFYELFDGFVILHGTDTMAYTASALSFMFEQLGKSVVITGSQIPLFETRSDGRENFLCSLIIAGIYNIPEVTILFDNKLFRGNRTSKISTSSLNCFNSPNMRPLAKIGIRIQVEEKDIYRSPKIKRFRVHSTLNRNVGLLRLFPSITVEVVRAFMSPPIEGVVLQTYGAGNGPTGRTDILEEIKSATSRGVIIVNCTQCNTGKVDNSYETGNILLELGVVPGSDMTPEAALTKLSYVLSKSEWSLETKRQEKETLRNALYPSIVCSIAAANNLEKLEVMQQFGVYFSTCDYNQRTPLHVASILGHTRVVEYLLHHGANVHLRDFDHKTPLLNAIEHDHHDIIKLLIQAGASLNLPSVNVGDLLCRAVKKSRIQRIVSLLLAGANINERDCGQRTALHIAVEMNNEEIVEFLLKHKVDTTCTDIYGRTALDIAKILNRQNLIQLLEKNNKVSPLVNGI